MQDYGHVLFYDTVTKGLQELCPDLHFDMAGCTDQWHPYIEERAGVFYNGRHICSIDRGTIPEFKVWSLETGVVEIPPEMVPLTELAWTNFREVLPTDPDYLQGLAYSKNYENGYALEDGVLKHYRGFKLDHRKGRVVKVGWRHTFERILLYDFIPITRGEIAKKFNVDMLKYPVGTATELYEALVAE